MLVYLSTTSLRREEKDGHTWGSEDQRCFSVSSAYVCLANQGRGSHLGVFKLLWKAKAFPNVVTMAWRALTDSLPTRERLSRKGVMLNNPLCVLCQTKVESSQHLFMECKHALCVWSMCFRWVGIVLVQHNDIKINFESFHLYHVNNKQNLVWSGVWAAIVRSIWDQRNEVVFKQEVVDAEEIFQKAQIKAWLWLKHKSNSFTYSLVD